jgi:hypothetical protein
MMSFAAHIGVIASREHRPQFFTSNLYPLVIDDTINVSNPSASRGMLLRVVDDNLNFNPVSMVGGTLTTVIRYPVYDHQPPEDINLYTTRVLSGNLTTVIAYKVYDHPLIEIINLTKVNILNGTLTVVINYVQYSGQIESFNMISAGIIGGTLAIA